MPYARRTSSRQLGDGECQESAWKRKVTVAFSCVLSVLPVAGVAQTGVPEVRLGDAVARLPEGFTNIVSLVELGDGRVIIADQRERRLVVGDFATGAVRDIGRRGQGPGEYITLSGAFPLRSDSVLIFDSQQGRALILMGDRIVATISNSALSAAAGGGRVVGADSLGFLLSQITRPTDPTRPFSLPDSITLRVAHRNSGVADTVARIRQGAVQLVPAGGTAFQIRIPVLGTAEDELLFSDGWLAIVRLQPYRVDWRNPQGGWTYGPPLPFERIEMDDREKRAHQAYLAATGQPDVPVDADWPEVAPPFHYSPQHNVLAPGPRGLLFIKRVPTADRFGSWYDVVDRSGALIARLILELNQRLLTFGSNGAYVVSTDAFGLEHVHRYAVPPLP